MAKFLLAIFLIIIGCRLKADILAIGISGLIKQVCSVEEFGEPEKETGEQDSSGTETEYTFYYHSSIPLLEHRNVNSPTAPFEYFKPSSGFINPAFTPPNLS